VHRGHDHHHHHDGNGAGDGMSRAGPGHNHAAPRNAAQWQTPHLPHGQAHEAAPPGEPDLDLVEAAFVEGFNTASDPTSFLRLACVPFDATAADGVRLVLLRIEAEQVTDVGCVTPHLGGTSFRYDPLPATLVGRRRRLRFIYRDAEGTRALSYAEVRGLVL
jgi:hypothetical protein